LERGYECGVKIRMMRRQSDAVFDADEAQISAHSREGLYFSDWTLVQEGGL
jgi:hypothetical protein